MLDRHEEGQGRLEDFIQQYYCVGEDSLTSHETWSSSKIFAMANAAGSLRGREFPNACAPGSAGLDSSTTGKNGPHTQLGDLATIVCSYDTTANYTSNSLSSYFHDLGGRQTLEDLVRSDWLTGKGNESLGGNYGENTPGDLGYDLTPLDSSAPTCSAARDSNYPIFSNSLSSLAAAEMTRRLVLHSSVRKSLRFPLLQQEDVDVIIRGTSSSSPSLFPRQAPFGGMSADTSIFLQAALDMVEVERASAGRWAIYSKLGSGYSSSRHVEEIINNAYGCFPFLGGGQGLEITLSVRGSVENDTSLFEAERVVLEAVQAVVAAILDGKIE